MALRTGKKADGTPASAILGIELEFNPSGSGDAPVSKAARSILSLLEKHPEEIVPSTQLDAVPKPISRQVSIYPLAMYQAGQTGKATISVFIDQEGNVQLPAIVSNSAPEFGYAAGVIISTQDHRMSVSTRPGAYDYTDPIRVEGTVKPPPAGSPGSEVGFNCMDTAMRLLPRA